MATVRPTQLFPGYTSDGTNVTIPLASLPKLTAANANAATGNGIDFIWAVLDAAIENINGLAVEARPTKATLTKANPVVVPGGNGAISQAYTFNPQLMPTGYDLVDEP